MTTETTTDPVESHPLVVQALADVDAALKLLERTRAAVVNGQPVSADDLATARSNVERCELLVDRARNLAAKDIRRRQTAEQRAERIRDIVAEAGGDPLGDLEQLRTVAIDALVALAAAADERTRLARGAAIDAIGIEDHQSLGLFVDDPASPLMIRTTDVVLATARPLAALASALEEAIRVAGIDAPDLAQPLAVASYGWQKATEFAALGAHRGPLLTAEQRRQADLRRRERRQFNSQASTRRATFESEERYRQSHGQPSKAAEFDATEAQILERFETELAERYPDVV